MSEPFGTADLMQGADLGSVKDNVGELNLQQTDLYGARTRSEAKRDALAVLSALQRCQHEPAGHWCYGQLHHGPLQDGDHVWMDTVDGHGRTTGGVAVLLRGTRFGVVEVSAAVGDGDDAIKNTMLPAEDRLAA